MLLALNIVSLLLVIALAWAGVWWLSRRVHRSSLRHRSVASSADVCVTCDGVGAKSNRGRVEPCPSCQGTGVRSSA